MAGTEAEDADGFTPEQVLRPKEQVEKQLREAILSGVFGEGKRLPGEIALAKSFSVSRGTVREALGSLQASGLVERSPGAGGGSFVRSLDPESLARDVEQSLEGTLRLGSIEFDEVISLRKMLEVPSVELAAVHRSDEDVQRIRRVLDRQRQTTVDDPNLSELDTNFHVAVARASGNRALYAFVAALHRAIRPARMLHISEEVGRESVTQHLAIARGIIERDPQAAKMEMERHLAYLDRARLYSADG